jgi:hypothetical protein
MFIKRLLIFLFVFILSQTHVYAQRADGHSPIGIMGDHAHKKGEIMFSYRFMFMDMNGNMDGTEELSNAEVLDPNNYNYMVVPESMPMQMHMLGAMYAVSDKVTLTAMFPFMNMEMDHLTRMGGTFTTESSGIGDIKLSGIYTISDTKNGQLLGQLGFSLPTGSIEQQDVTPASAPNETILPYPMQIGSGTFDLMPAITYRGFTPKISYGIQSRATLRLEENSNDYSLGNVLDNNFWLGYNLSPWIAPAFRLRALFFGDISGADPRFNMALANNMIHTVDPDLKNGTRVDAGLGLNFLVPRGALKTFRLSLEYDLPVYQNLDGPQMQMDGILTFGIMYTIK